MKLIFTSSFKRPVPLIISILTRSKISHCEFVFSDGLTIYPSVYSCKTILTRKRYVDPNIYSFDLNVSAEEEAVVRQWAEETLGTPYDYSCIALTRSTLRRKKNSWKDPGTWMCSEFCAYGLDLIGWNFFPDNEQIILPCDLYNKMKEMENSYDSRLAFN